MSDPRCSTCRGDRISETERLKGLLREVDRFADRLPGDLAARISTAISGDPMEATT